MIRQIFGVGLLTFVTCLSSCGIQSQALSTLKSTPADGTAFVLIMSGFLSCAPGSKPSQIAIVPASENALSFVKQRYSHTTVLYSCFAAEVDRVLISLYSATGGEPKEFDVTRDEFSDFIATQIELETVPDLYIFAYSYGGDLLAQMIAQFPHWLQQIRALATVDLIGADVCPPLVFALGIATVRPREGCLQAPAREAFKDIGRGAVPWQNLYQNTGYFIHSGVIDNEPEQDSPKNSLIDFQGWSSSFDAHAKIRDDARTWDAVEALFESALQP